MNTTPKPTSSFSFIATGKNPPTTAEGFLRSLVMKMLILSNKKFLFSCFDEISIQKKYVRIVSIYKKLSKKTKDLLYNSLRISSFFFISEQIPAKL